uniref:Uncharacterized protein n=1 Tax=Meloidogyne incognita TaxID=6306 RepID=A0A914LWI1_MELIC
MERVEDLNLVLPKALKASRTRLLFLLDLSMFPINRVLHSIPSVGALEIASQTTLCKVSCRDTRPILVGCILSMFFFRFKSIFVDLLPPFLPHIFKT